MSNDFDWRTEDDGSWEDGGEERPFSHGPTLLSRLKKRRRWLGLAAVLLIIIGAVIYVFFNQQVEQAEDENTAGVLAAHALVRQAGAERDFDLLGALMLDSNSGWAKSQLYLLNVGLFLDRRPLGLEIASEEPPARAAITATLSPDLQTAQLIERIPYRLTPDQIGASQRVSETVWLEHTFNYQRQENSWLLGPLPEDETFWGKWENADFGDRLMIIHSERDADIADYLGQRLNALIDEICSDDDVECPPGFKMELRLTRNLNGLKALNDNIRTISLSSNNVGLYHLSLPSPTLVGRPVDEARYKALYRGYASWVAAVMAVRFTDGPLVADQVVEGWQLSMPPEPQAAVPFTQPLPQPPIPFPEQDILLVCTDITNMTLLRFNPSANQWSDELGGHETTYLSSQINEFFGAFMAVLPDDSGVLLNVSRFSRETLDSKIVVWQDGQEHLLVETDVPVESSPEADQWLFDPGGRNIVFFARAFAQTENGQEERTTPYAFNLEDCLSGECEPRFYDGFPYWSPDLTWVLLADLEMMSQLTLRNEGSGEEISLENGYSPYWIDEASFIYARTVEQPEGSSQLTQIVAATVDDPLNGRILLDSTDIAAVFNVEEPTATPWIRAVVAHPAQPDWLFIVAISDLSKNPFDQYILSFDSETGQLHQVMEVGSDLLAYPFQIVQDGRSLVVKTTGSTGLRTIIPLDPAEKTIGEPSTLQLDFSYREDWSQDGRWLLIAGQNYLGLFAPGYAYYGSVNYDDDSCTEAVWINSLPDDE